MVLGIDIWSSHYQPYNKILDGTFSLHPMILSPQQRRLLGINDDDPLFQTETPTKINRTDYSD